MSADAEPDEEPFAVARQMWADDAVSRGLGMELVELSPGRAVVRMPVRADMLNGYAVTHGGLVATLADSTFALACNSRGRRAVAAGFDIAFLAPTHEGDVLVATAEERTVRGRSGIYDVTVRRDGPGGGPDGGPDGEVVVEFRGRSRAIG